MVSALPNRCSERDELNRHTPEGTPCLPKKVHKKYTAIANEMIMFVVDSNFPGDNKKESFKHQSVMNRLLRVEVNSTKTGGQSLKVFCT